ncbi:hypothetical protein AVEN_234076-1, partial [Araneus ventricosus]
SAHAVLSCKIVFLHVWFCRPFRSAARGGPPPLATALGMLKPDFTKYPSYTWVWITFNPLGSSDFTLVWAAVCLERELPAQVLSSYQS